MTGNGTLVFPLSSKFVDELYRIFLEIPTLPAAVSRPENRAKDGHVTRSYGERRIDDWLHDHLSEAHMYFLRISREDQEITCDWYLPELGLYLEYWESPRRGEETNAMHIKHMFYSRFSLKVVDLFEEDFAQADQIIAESIRSIEPRCRFKELLGKIRVSSGIIRSYMRNVTARRGHHK